MILSGFLDPVENLTTFLSDEFTFVYGQPLGVYSGNFCVGLYSHAQVTEQLSAQGHEVWGVFECLC